MIRILHFLSDLDISSGASVVAMNYYRNINKEHVQFDFLYFEDTSTNCIDEIETLGGNVYRIQKPNFSKESIKELNNFFKEHQNTWTALHCHPVYGAVVVGRFARKYGIKNIIQHSHSTQFGNTKKSSMRNYLISKMNPFIVTDYFACSQEAARLLGWKFIWKDKVHILHNAILCERFKYDDNKRNQIRSQYGIQENTVVIGHTGRFSVEKNHEYLLAFFYEYHKLNSNSKLILLGDGQEKENIQKIISENALSEDVLMVGNQKCPENYLCAMDFFIFPSFYEGISLALLEAQCNGLVCFVSDRVDIQSKQINQYYSFSLDTKPDKLAKIVYEQPLNADRRISYYILKNSHFNLIQEVNKLERFYESLEG